MTNSFTKLKLFKEKPDYNTAKEYVSSGNYLWNSGYFVGSIDTFKEKLAKHSPKRLEDYEKLLGSEDGFEKIYLDFENNSIDYDLIEKVDDLYVVPASFDWMDLGSFGDLHKAADSDEKGNHVHGDVELEDVENCFIQNHGNVPLGVIGLDNVAVVNTKDGILVTRKGMAQKVGDVSKRINKRKT